MYGKGERVVENSASTLLSGEGDNTCFTVDNTAQSANNVPTTSTCTVTQNAVAGMLLKLKEDCQLTQRAVGEVVEMRGVICDPLRENPALPEKSKNELATPHSSTGL